MGVQGHSGEGKIYVYNNKIFFPLWFELFFDSYNKNKDDRKFLEF
jgi:hypothetical protein